MLVLILVLVVYDTYTIHVIPTLFYISSRPFCLVIVAHRQCFHQRMATPSVSVGSLNLTSLRRAMSATPLDPKTPITLVSSEGDAFVVEYEIVRASSVLEHLFASSEAADFEEQRTKVFKLRDVSTSILRKIIEWMEYKRAHEHSSKMPPRFEIDGEDAIELLMAANYLDI